MGQEISQQQNQQQQQPHQQHQQQSPHKRQPQQRKSFSGISTNNTGNHQAIYTPSSHLSTSSSSTSFSSSATSKNNNNNNSNNNSNNNNNNNNINSNQNYRLRHKYNLSKQTYERSKIPIPASQSDSDSHYAKLNLLRSSFQSSDSGIYNSSCHCSSVSSLSISSSSRSSSSTSSSSRGCPSSLVSSKSSNRSLDKQKHYLHHHLYIKSYLDILEEDERARAHFKSARPGGIRNYTPKILASGGDSTISTCSSTAGGLSSSAPAHCYGASGKRPSSGVSVSGAPGAGGFGAGASKHSSEDPWI
ncbi:hypothetical protein KR059_007060 [Drosophila kikkawai]|nr:hypothetical protein KR059_007060 [Drosophila kikkawai]